jgi:hypothetical protein
MRLTIDHPIALADDRFPDGLGQVTFPGAGWTKKKCIFAASDERGRRQVKDHAPIHFLVKVEIEVVEGHLRIAKLCLFPAPFQQSVAATSQFIGHQTGEEVDGGHRFRLRLLQARLQHRNDAAETQLVAIFLAKAAKKNRTYSPCLWNPSAIKSHANNSR